MEADIHDELTGPQKTVRGGVFISILVGGRDSAAIVYKNFY